MSTSHAHQILRAADVRPHLLEQWVMSELSPGFDAQAAEVCGLYLDPPENTIVVSIDEKTGIQAKGLVRPDTQAAPGKPARRDNEYQRNGTQNLFAALQVHSGGISATPAKTRNRDDLLGVPQFTPTHASWLNQVEIFLSILQRRPIKHGAFDSEADLAEQMLCFVETYDQTAQSFQWTYTGKVLNA